MELRCQNQCNPLKVQEMLQTRQPPQIAGKRVELALLVNSAAQTQLFARFWCRTGVAGDCDIHGQEFLIGRSKLSAARGGVNQRFTRLVAGELPNPTSFMRWPITLAKY
jgi:hypothetical protein